MRKMILYFRDDGFSIVYNGKVMNIQMESIVDKGEIVDRGRFMEEFPKIIKAKKIKSKLFGDNIYLVKNSYFNNRDIFFWESLFSDLGFIKVIYIDIRDFFLDSDSTYVEINKGYLVLNLDKGIYLELDYIQSIEDVLVYFSKYMKKNVILFGSNDSISKVKCDSMNVYYMEDNINYITQSLLKVKKCDV